MVLVQGLDVKIYSWKRKEGNQELTTKVKLGSALLTTALGYHETLMVQLSIFVPSNFLHLYLTLEESVRLRLLYLKDCS